jgi:hypothetical protein
MIADRKTGAKVWLSASLSDVYEMVPGIAPVRRGVGSAALVVDQRNAGPSIVGSAILTTTGNVGGFAIFRYNPTAQEAVVPLETRNAGAYPLAFDDTNGLRPDWPWRMPRIRPLLSL